MDDPDFKWFPCRQPERDISDEAMRRWMAEHWHGYVRTRCLEHLRGTKFSPELDRRDFGILPHLYHDHPQLLDQILARLKAGNENLEILLWAQNEKRDIEQVIEILEALDVYGRRLSPHI